MNACTAKTKRCANARDYHSALRPCCRGHLVRMMTDFAESANRHGVRWWADYGTLLGAVRNPLTTRADYPWLDPEVFDGMAPLAPGIIPHDKDCDLGALSEDWRLLLLVRLDLEAKGYHVRVRKQSASIKIRLSEINTTNIDVFTWDSAADGILHRRTYINVDRFKGRHFPRAWVENRGLVEWEGLTLPAPADPVSFCEFRYGDTWRTPVAANHDGVRRST